MEDATDTEEDEIRVNFRQALSSSPIPFSPPAIDCNRVQNLEGALETYHQMPHLQPIIEGRVYDMTPVLNSIEQIQPQNQEPDVIQNANPHLQPIIPGQVYNMDQILDSVESEQRQQDIQRRAYSLREKERVDYKKLHRGQ